MTSGIAGLERRNGQITVRANKISKYRSRKPLQIANLYEFCSGNDKINDIYTYVNEKHVKRIAYSQNMYDAIQNSHARSVARIVVVVMKFSRSLNMGKTHPVAHLVSDRCE